MVEVSSKTEQKDRDTLLEMLQYVRGIFRGVGVEGQFTTFTNQKPYLLEASFFATLSQVTKIVEACEAKYGERTELGVATENSMVAPCTKPYEYFIDIIYDE